jgi:hypothetical protein
MRGSSSLVDCSKERGEEARAAPALLVGLGREIGKGSYFPGFLGERIMTRECASSVRLDAIVA